MSWMLPTAIVASAGLGAGAAGYGAHEQAHIGKKQLKDQKKYQKKAERQLHKGIKEQKRFNYKQYAGRYGIKAANKKLAKFQRKYGDESFKKHSALTGGQQSTLHKLGKAGREGLKNLRTPEDIYNIRNEPGFREGRQGLQQMLRNPGVSQIEQFGPYQQGVANLQDLLSNDPQAIRAFEEREISDYKNKILPQLGTRYAGQTRGSAFQNAQRSAETDLVAKLRALRYGEQARGREQALQFGQAPLPGQQLRSGIQQSAANQLLGYSQAPLAGETAQTQNLLSQNEQARALSQGSLGVNPYTSIYRPPSFNPGFISGGPAPPNRGGLPQPQYQPYTSGWGQAGASVLGGLAQGAGNYAAQNYFNQPAASAASPAAAAGGAGAAGGDFKPDWAHSFL